MGVGRNPPTSQRREVGGGRREVGGGRWEEGPCDLLQGEHPDVQPGTRGEEGGQLLHLWNTKLSTSSADSPATSASASVSVASRVASVTR